MHKADIIVGYKIDRIFRGLLEFGVMGIANGILTIYTPYV